MTPHLGILFSRNKQWAQKLIQQLQDQVELAWVESVEDFEDHLHQMDPCLVLFDVRAPNDPQYIFHLGEQYPNATIIAFGALDSDPIHAAERAGVQACLALDAERITRNQTIRSALQTTDLAEQNEQLREQLETAGRVHPSPAPGSSEPSGTSLLNLRHFSRMARNIDHLDHLLERIVESVETSTAVQRLGIFLREESSLSYTLRSSLQCTPAIREKTYPARDPFVRYIEQHMQILHREQVERMKDAKERNWLNRTLGFLGADLILPLYSDGTVLGWMFLGGKVTGENWHARDISDLAVIAEHIATTIGTALRLEETVIQRTLATTLLHDKTQERTSQLHQERLESSRFWTDLAAAMSHEIKNPLTTIKTFAQLLPERFDDEEFRHSFSKQVNHEADQLNAIVEQINDFAHHRELQFSPIDLKETVELALERVSLGEQIEIKNELEDTLPTVQGDRNALIDCFEHLLINAKEAMKDNGTITIRNTLYNDAEGNPEQIALHINDNGPGISADRLPEIFSPFCTTKARGLGLGLPIAQRIITEHGGTLEAKTSDRGTFLTISIPIYQPREEESK